MARRQTTIAVPKPERVIVRHRRTGVSAPATGYRRFDPETPRRELAPRKPIIEDGWDESAGSWTSGSPVGRYLAAMRAGASPPSAAAYAGVGRPTVTAWTARGREYRPDVEPRREDVPADQRVYVDFVTAAEASEGSLEVELSGLAVSAAREDPKFALSVLRQRFPHWRDALHVSIDADVIEEDELVDLLEADPMSLAVIADLAHRLEDLRQLGPVTDQVIEAEILGEK